MVSVGDTIHRHVARVMPLVVQRCGGKAITRYTGTRLIGIILHGYTRYTRYTTIHDDTVHRKARLHLDSPAPEFLSPPKAVTSDLVASS